MDQAQASSGVGHGPLVGRRSLALATAAVLASASSTAGFSPTSASPLSCYANTQQSTLLDEPRRPGEHAQRRRSLHVLNVSFMEDLMTTTSPMPPQPKKRAAASRAPLRVRKIPPKETRSVEIGLQPDYEFLGLDVDDFAITAQSEHSGSDLASASNGKHVREKSSQSSDPSSNIPQQAQRSVPEIDSEILSEGIITSAPPPVLGSKKVEASKGAVMAVSTGKQAVSKSTNKSSSSSQKKSSANTKKKSKSSTMPGFIKDTDLDRHVTNLSLQRLPPSSVKAKAGRAARSKSAKLKRRQTNSATMYRRAPSVGDSLVDYTNEIHAISRVTPKEEKELGSLTQEAIRLQGLHTDLTAKYGRDPTDDEWCAAAGKMNVVAIKEAIEDGMEAKNQLVASNLRMVQRVVNLYIRNGLGSEYDAGDLMQDGTMALIRAAEKYEPERGFRFSTYAMYWIRSAVKRSQTSQSRIVMVPQRIHETHKRMTKNDARLRKELGREPTKPELAAACEISVLQLDRCRKAMSQVTFSLDAEVQNSLKPNNGSSRKDTMYDIVEGKVDETEYEKTQRLFMKEHLITTLRKFLSPHEVDLLLLRYGLMDDRALPKGMSGPLTIAEVSKLVGLKPDKVRRIIINSQKQLKHLMREWEDFEFELA